MSMHMSTATGMGVESRRLQPSYPKCGQYTMQPDLPPAT